MRRPYKPVRRQLNMNNMYLNFHNIRITIDGLTYQYFTANQPGTSRKMEGWIKFKD